MLVALLVGSQSRIPVAAVPATWGTDVGATGAVQAVAITASRAQTASMILLTNISYSFHSTSKLERACNHSSTHIGRRILRFCERPVGRIAYLEADRAVQAIRGKMDESLNVFGWTGRRLRRNNMALKVTLTIPDSLYRQAERLGTERGKQIEEVLVDAIDLSEQAAAIGDDGADLTEPDTALAQEQAAYVAMFPELQASHFGQHVAIYGGVLVDSDSNFSKLYERIIDKFPEQAVWISKVGDEPTATIFFRSPRVLTR
ncbi:MAG: hypothetical protein HC802_16480 [Caldilineaceae bacterium]|nr:hypothetical protein [Caldilineaceae bacterium]